MEKAINPDVPDGSAGASPSLDHADPFNACDFGQNPDNRVSEGNLRGVSAQIGGVRSSRGAGVNVELADEPHWAIIQDIGHKSFWE
jgi:hypothetical protein